MTDNFNLKKFLTENKLTTNAKAQEAVNEGSETSWKDLWDALQAALDKEDDAEAENALKVIAKAAASKVGAHAKSAVDRAGAYAKDKLQKYDDSLNEERTPERIVYDIVEDSANRALRAIESYKEDSELDQSGDSGVFHDVEIALEEVLDLLIYTQK
jgi:hypothetical protein